MHHIFSSPHPLHKYFVSKSNLNQIAQQRSSKLLTKMIICAASQYRGPEVWLSNILLFLFFKVWKICNWQNQKWPQLLLKLRESITYLTLQFITLSYCSMLVFSILPSSIMPALFTFRVKRIIVLCSVMHTLKHIFKDAICLGHEVLSVNYFLLRWFNLLPS